MHTRSLPLNFLDRQRSLSSYLVLLPTTDTSMVCQVPGRFMTLVLLVSINLCADLAA
jgi:hypothetical protein